MRTKLTVLLILLFMTLIGCSTPRSGLEISESANKDSTEQDYLLSIAGRYRFQTRVDGSQSVFPGWWGEMVLTSDRFLQIFRSSETGDTKETALFYGKLTSPRPGVIEIAWITAAPNKLTGTLQYEISNDKGALILRRSASSEERWILVRPYVVH